MQCNCDDWKNNIEKVNDPIKLQSARSGFDGEGGFNWKWDGKPFTHCPWCGWALTDEDEPHQERMFGEHIREALKALSPLWKRKKSSGADDRPLGPELPQEK